MFAALYPGEAAEFLCIGALVLDKCIWWVQRTRKGVLEDFGNKIKYVKNLT